VRDVLAPGLRVLFVGINPGLYSSAVGHNFAQPGNRFWKTLHQAGLTPRLLTPFEERELLAHGMGITNLVARATASAAELSVDKLRRGAKRLRRKVARYRPALVAFLGLGAYRTALGQPAARIGPQTERLGRSQVWLLPNPSGLNAHHQLPELTRLFRNLRRAALDGQGSVPGNVARFQILEECAVK
jgi:TDG/mug DNA glycosylase family protein